MTSCLAIILSLVLHVAPGERINDALDVARAAYAVNGESTTIWIAPGTYQEPLTIDVPGLQLRNASRHPSIALREHGVQCDVDAVRITWYYGHGYQYRTMDTINYGGSRSRLWNASVLVTAPDFYAENIIFENSFNLYISEKEAADSLYILDPYTARPMPERPKEVGSTLVQRKLYRERAAAISFAQTATHAHLKNCRAVGRQDVLYGDQGASIYWQGGILQGSVDFIFGAMTLAVDRALIIANINGENNDKCYISAGRSEEGKRGMLFYRCHIRLANEDELELFHNPSPTPNAVPQVWLARPWRWWGETVWAYTTWDKQIVNPDAWHTGLTKGKECPNSYEYRSQDHSVGRPSWVTVLKRPVLPDGTRIRISHWR